MLLISGIEQIGGIERVNELVLRVCDDYCRDKGFDLIAISKNDTGAGGSSTRFSAVELLGCGGSKRRFMWAAATRAIRRRPVAVYVGHANFAAIAMVLRSVRVIGPYVVQAHGIEVWGPLSRRLQRALRAAERILSVSGYTAARVVEAVDGDASRIDVVPLALLPSWTERSSAGSTDTIRSEGEPVLLTIARLTRDERRKRIGAVVEALGDLHERGIAFHYVVVGGGPGRVALEKQVATRGIADHVAFVGSLGDPDVHRLLAGCDVFVMPSTQEGFGLVFLEAMWYGKPVIAAAAGGAPEVVVDGVTGLLVAPDDPSQLTATLATMVSDADLRARLGRAGARRVRDELSYERFHAALTRELDRLVGTGA